MFGGVYKKILDIKKKRRQGKDPAGGKGEGGGVGRRDEFFGEYIKR